MNLSTARSERRAKEVGIRKTIGSVRAQIVNQFFSESFLIVILAFALAIFIAAISLSWFNDIAVKQLTILWTNPWFWLMGVGLIFLTSLLAGSYPALYLSSFQPVKVLKGTFLAGRFASAPRKILVVVQFILTIS
jgi:putative ABC transport system permease protein